MYLKQLSVFMENKDGKLSEIIDLLSKNDINLHALSIADTTDFGILRLIVDDPQKAAEALKADGFVVKISDVLAVGMEDKPGSLAKLLQIISSAGIGVEYMYAFVSRVQGKALMVVRVNDNEKAVEALRAQGVELVGAAEFYA